MDNRLKTLRDFCLQKKGVNDERYPSVMVPSDLFLKVTQPMTQGIQLQECIITFPIAVDANEAVKSGSSQYFTTEVYTSTLPKGLVIWGHSDNTFIDQILVGTNMQAVNTHSAIPASYFSGHNTFDEILKLAEKGELELSLEQRQILTMAPVYPGIRLTVVIRGPFSNFCMWGVTPTGIPAPAFAEIKKVDVPASSEPGGSLGRTYYLGRIVRPTLKGEEYEQIRIEAPTSHDAAVVLAPSLASSGIRGMSW